MIRLSANLGFLWPDRPLPARVQAAAHAGFAAIELHGLEGAAPGEIRRLCTDLGLVVVSLNTGRGTSGAFGLAALLGQEAAFRADFDETLTAARAIGAGAIHVLAGVVAPDTRQQATATLAANLAWAATRSAGHGVILLLEALNTADNPGYLYASVDEVVAVLDRIGAPSVRLLFDAYHVARSGEDVAAQLVRFHPRLGHVQIAGVPRRDEPVGSDLDYGAVFATLDRLDYRGWVGCEYRPAGDTDVGLAWRETLGVAPGRTFPRASLA